MNIFSQSDLLDQLTGSHYTFGFGAIVCLDTRQSNQLLMAEYIARFNKAAFLDPISGEFKMTDTMKEGISGLLLDAPRLRFDDGNISGSTARLTFHCIKGSRARYELDGGGVYTIVQLDYLDILSGPKLKMKLDLKLVEGEVGQDEIGEVRLDITDGTELNFSYAGTEYENQQWTLFFKQKFDEYKQENENKVRYILNRIGSNKDHFLKVKNFTLRTHKAPGAKVRNSPNFQQGEILLFIEMVGQSGIPTIPVNDSDMPYLTPDGTSVTILLGNRFLLETIVAEGCKNIISNNEFSSKFVSNENDVISKMVITRGETTQGDITTSSLPNFSLIKVNNIRLPMYEEDTTSFEVFFERDILTLSWKGFISQGSTITVKGGSSYNYPIRFSWDMTRKYKFQLNTSNSTVELKHITAEDISHYKINLGQDYLAVDDIRIHYLEIVNYIEDEFVKKLKSSLDLFTAPTSEINLFTLYALLFRSENAVELQSIHYPYDLTTFGVIAPNITDFAITPMEISLSDGEVYPFKLEGNAPSAVKWTVENAPDYEGGIGFINENSGEYTAPNGNSISEGYTRVIITAADKNNTQRRSSALVTIIVASIEVNPKVRNVRPEVQEGYGIFVGNKGGKTIDPVVHSRFALSSNRSNTGKQNENALTAVPGTIQPGQGENEYLYLPPGKDNNLFLSIDEIIVTNSDTQASKSSWCIVNHSPPNAFIRYKNDSGDEMLLELIDSYGYDFPLQDYDITYHITLGDGTVEQRGDNFFYVPAQHNTDSHVILVAEIRHKTGPRYDSFACVIMPISDKDGKQGKIYQVTQDTDK
jgi:hypothetical protein